MNKSVIKSLVLSLLLCGISLIANASSYTKLFTNISAVDASTNGNLRLSLISGLPAGTFASHSNNSLTSAFTLSAWSNLDSIYSADQVDHIYMLLRTDKGTSSVEGEAVTFTISGLNPNCFTSLSCEQNNQPLFASAFELRVTNNPNGNNNTAISWYSGATIDPALAVPEPLILLQFIIGMILIRVYFLLNKKT